MKNQNEELIRGCQSYIAQKYPELVGDDRKREQLISHIRKYFEGQADVAADEVAALTTESFREMARYSLLTPYIEDEGDIEEININAWNDITATDTHGSVSKLPAFRDADHALAIIRRMLRESGAVLDNASPIAQGELKNGVRLTAIKPPLVPEGVGVSASLRKQHFQRLGCEDLVAGGTLSQEMLDFLALCLRYGLSFVIVGPTSSGKTTLLNALLTTLPEGKRIFIIESGARELRAGAGGEEERLSIVSTLSRPSENDFYNISQEDLVVASLRFSPDAIIIGEMRDQEASSAIEASLTGHFVASTIHAGSAEGAHLRLAMLAQKKTNADFQTAALQAALAFPLIVTMGKGEHHERRIFDITECRTDSEGRRAYRVLFEYRDGAFVRVNEPGPATKAFLSHRGYPNDSENT